MSSKDEKKQHRVRVLLGEECVRKNANAVHDWEHLLLSCDFEDAVGLFELAHWHGYLVDISSAILRMHAPQSEPAS